MHFLGLKLFTCQETCHVQYVHCVQNTNMCVICASVQGSLFAYRLHFCTWSQGFFVGHVSEFWIVFNFHNAIRTTEMGSVKEIGGLRAQCFRPCKGKYTFLVN